MDRYPKDPDLKGIYVKRCKCGARPYLDRIAISPSRYWIACNCGKRSISDQDFDKAINNWNKNKLYYEQTN